MISSRATANDFNRWESEAKKPQTHKKHMNSLIVVTVNHLPLTSGARGLHEIHTGLGIGRLEYGGKYYKSGLALIISKSELRKRLSRVPAVTRFSISNKPLLEAVVRLSEALSV